MGLGSLILEILGVDENPEENGLIDTEQLKYICPNMMSCIERENEDCSNGNWNKCQYYTN